MENEEVIAAIRSAIAREIADQVKKINLGNVRGKDGTNGTNGRDGVDGKSPYQVAVENGYDGAEEEFNAALASMQNAPFLPLSIGRDGATVDIGGGLTLQTEEKNAYVYVSEAGTITIISQGTSGLGDDAEEWLSQVAVSPQYVLIGSTGEKSGTAVINITRDGTDFTGRVVFSDNVSVPEPTEELHAVNKGYVDDLVGDINSALDAINGEVV